MSLRSAMLGDASNYEKAVDVVNRSFNMLEQAKKKEVVTDASRALAGEVQQGGPYPLPHLNHLRLRLLHTMQKKLKHLPFSKKNLVLTPLRN